MALPLQPDLIMLPVEKPHSIKTSMRVIKRSGAYEDVNFEKIAERIRKLSWNLSDVDGGTIVARMAASMCDKITTEKIDQLTADIAIGMEAEHPEYGILAARIATSNMHKKTSESVMDTWERLETVLSPEFLERARTHADELQQMIDYRRDYEFDYFGLGTLEKLYCAKLDGVLVERPQHMYLRVALAVCGIDGDLDRVKETYDLMSRKKFTHASPTLFNAGMNVQQCASCFLLSMDDSLDGIFDCFHDSARISKYGGGLGVNISKVRSKGAPITSTNGNSDGIVPMLKVANSIACYINQGGKRRGSMAVYIEPHHPDIFDFLNLRRPGGDDEMRARDLFLAMWISDEFMRRVESGGTWSLMDPSLCPGLDEAVGEAFSALYRRYEAEGKAVRTLDARELWNAILRSQIESGLPYLCYKDACNLKSNQQNLGTITNSNLCVAGDTEILTSDGHRSIKSAVGHCVDVWNGEAFSTVKIVQTGCMQPLVTVTFSNGRSIRCTPYHTFYVLGDDGTTVRKLSAADLVAGMDLPSWRLPNGLEESGITVTSVVDDGDVEDTYCFTEPMRNMGVFNGILAGNCAEIIEYTDPGKEVAVCTLASVGLPAYVKKDGKTFDFEELHRVTKIVAKNLDTVIDINRYPIEEARYSNMRHRPVGIGIQGLADTFIKLGLAYDAPEALTLTENIAATMYHAAIDSSTELAAIHGPYETYEGSPASKGLLQYDLWGVTDPCTVDGLLDWDALKRRVARFGLRNSLSIAVMPTASTAQLLGNSEAGEPVTSFYYVRRTLAGEYACIHTRLLRDLIKEGLWTKSVRNAIIRDGGSIQDIPEIPQHLKKIYKTSWDLKQRAIIDHAARRGPYVCQSQSMNLFVAAPTFAKLSAMHLYAWKSGLKTGCYYLRSKPAARAQQITVDVKEEDAACLMCSS